jgi:hypothetical protein
LFDRAAGFSLAPTACHRGRRAQVVSRLAALAATFRLGLYTTEHDGILNRSGRPFLLLLSLGVSRIIDANLKVIAQANFQFPLTLPRTGSGSGKSRKKRAGINVKKREPAY